MNVGQHLGRPQPFEASGDANTVSIGWKAWLEEFESYADSVGLFYFDDEDTMRQRRALLLYTAGKNVRDTFKTLPDVDNPSNYEEAVTALNKHYIVKPNAAFQRHKFRKTTQSETETVAQFVTRLRQYLDGCEFQDPDTQICDQVIQECRSDQLRRKLLERGDTLNLQETLKIAATFEAVADQTKAMGATAAVSRVQTPQSTSTKGECYRCGASGHYGRSPQCPARGKTCRKCGGADHFAKKCRARKAKANMGEKDPESKSKEEDPGRQKQSRRPDRNSKVRGVITEDDSDSEVKIFMTRKVTGSENKIPVSVGGVKVEMIVDSGSDMNIIDNDLWRQLKNQKMKYCSSKCEKKLYAYTADTPLDTVDCFEAEIQAGDRSVEAEFVVIKQKGEALLSGSTATKLGVLKIGLNIQNIVSESDGENADLLTDFKPLFTGFGKLQGREVKLTVDPEVKPVAQPLRRTPFGLREKVAKKIQELVDKDIIEPVEKPTPWVSPLVIVPKPNNDIRLCVDLRRVNEAVLRERHPIPTVDEILQDMSESRVFSKLDLKMGYHQLELHPDSRDITTFVAHCGLYRFKRLVMGINAASEIYQHEIQQVVQGIPGVVNLSDDIMVHGPDKEEHDRRLRLTLQRLQEAGLTLNGQKCLFRKAEIEFLGHKLTAKGVDPARSKVEAILNAREPETATEVRSFLGLVNFCSRFIPNHATLSDPLRKLTRKDEKFVFGPEQKAAFQSLKEAMSSAQTLGYYDVKAHTQIITDASPVGLGSILIQIQDGFPRIICYASRSLTNVERRYSQTEKEALAIVWACERFHPYIYGMNFDLLTDHKPLQAIYGPRSRPSARVERWVLRLQAYNFRVIYIPGKANIADPLSRLLAKTTTPSTSEIDLAEVAEAHVHFVATNAAPGALTAEEIDEASAEDEELEQVRNCIETGRWQNCPNKLYMAISPELCTAGNLVLRGPRIVIPQKLRAQILALAHEGHLGIVGTKQNLRTKVWWPGMEKEAEKYCKSCHGCQLMTRASPPEPLKTTELPAGPWEDLAMDFLGPLPSGESVLVVIDYYSRYYEIAIMKSTAGERTVGVLKTIFARHGLPLSVRTDNGPQFVSEVFTNYLKNNGVKHVRTTPKWAQANGEVERQNDSLEKRMKIAQAEGKDWKDETLTYIAAYRALPHPSTGKSPAELLFGRKIRNRLPNVTPQTVGFDQEIRDRDAEKKGLSKLYADDKRKARNSDIEVGDTVLVKREQMGKLDTAFVPEPYKVIDKAGSKVTVESPEGAVYSRNSTCVKKYVTASDEPTPEPSPTRSKMDLTECPQTTPRRPERTKMQPKWLEDFVT